MGSGLIIFPVVVLFVLCMMSGLGLGQAIGGQTMYVSIGELNYRKGGLHSELLEVVRANEMEEKRNAGKVCPVCGQKMVHVCRVASAVKFEYAKFEDKFVLDLRDNWVKVELPRRWKKEKVEDDGGYDDFVKGFGGDVVGEEIS